MRPLFSLVFLVAIASGCEERTADRAAASAAQERPEPAPSPRKDEEPAPPGTSTRCITPFGAPAPIAKPAATCPEDPTGPLNLAKRWVTFPDVNAAPRVAVEIADNPSSRERGLMYRTKMPEDQGMLFSWSEESERQFWMRNTCLPLDMLFIAKDLTIVGIVEQVPTLNETPRGVPCPAAHVLELNAGWARAHGLAPGQKIGIE